MGCASHGFCYECGLFVEDSTCYCMGSNCPWCDKYVVPRNSPTNLNGIYPIYKRVPKTYYYVEYKDGKWFKQYTPEEALAKWEDQCNQN